MASENTLQKLSPLDIVVFHVGGVGSYGPVRKVIDRFPERTVVVVFEAHPSDKDLLIQKQNNERGIRTIFLPKCLGEKHSKQQFYVNKHRASSSIFPPGQNAVDEHVPFEGIHTWGENCEIDYVTELDTVTLDELILNKELPSPDIISMDVQGSEMPIMRGGERAVRDALSVINEVDFIEIYQGQELFCAQQNFLTERGYRLAEILNSQYWHPGPAAGEGFLTMGEALYFRELEACRLQFQGNDTKRHLHKLIKLAAIAYAFRRLSYSSKIITQALEEFGSDAESLLSSEKSFGPMFEAQQYMKNHHDDYMKDKNFFYRLSWKENLIEKKRVLRRKLAVKKGYVVTALKKLGAKLK